MPQLLEHEFRVFQKNASAGTLLEDTVENRNSKQENFVVYRSEALNKVTNLRVVTITPEHTERIHTLRLLQAENTEPAHHAQAENTEPAHLAEAENFVPRGPLGEPIPEPWEFAPAAKRAKTVFEIWPRKALALPTLLFAVMFYVASFGVWEGYFPSLAASGEQVFGRQEYWRLLSALFAHGDFAHFASNLLPFLFFGWILHAYFGKWLFPIASLFIGVVSNALTIFLYPANVGLVGASGMIYGMIGLWLVLYLHFAQEKRLAVRIMRATGFALIMLFPTQYQPEVSYLAHATGFATGVMTGVVVAPFVSPRAR